MDGDQLQIVGVDLSNPRFVKAFSKLDEPLRRQVRDAIGSILLVPRNAYPAKLHFHPLKSKKAKGHDGKDVPVYTIHVTPDDRYKASFTIEGGYAFFRVLGLHDDVDASP